MVTNADLTAKEVCFVDLDASLVVRLRDRCGPGYEIYPIGMAPSIETEAREAAHGYRLKDTGSEGELLSASIQKTRGRGAVVDCGYQTPTTAVLVRYKLRFTKDK